MNKPPFSKTISPDWEGLLRCISRQGTPQRVFFIELYLDAEMKEAVCNRFGLVEDLNPNDPYYLLRREIVLQRFLGYDYVRCGVDDVGIAIERLAARDTAALQRSGGRQFINEHRGPITSWEEFEAYPWPDPASIATRNLQWFQENLPEDMCIIGSGGFAHFAEYLTWLMGYETLCYALFEQRDLVAAISGRLTAIYEAVVKLILQYNRVRLIWGSDDMGFRSGTLISPRDLREFVLPGHRSMARAAHAAGRPYLLHSCGKLDAIMDDLLDSVQIDAFHSFEDTIHDVREAKKLWGDRIALLGGIDMDFLCRASAEQVRQRVRDTLDVCLPGGGYCLGTGNSVANYLPMDNYLAMLDEGRNYR